MHVSTRMVGFVGRSTATAVVVVAWLASSSAVATAVDGATESGTTSIARGSGGLLPPAGEILDRFGPDAPTADSAEPGLSPASNSDDASSPRPSSGWLLDPPGSTPAGNGESRPEEQQVIQRRGGSGWSAGRKAEASLPARQEAATSFWPGWEVLPLAIVVALILGVAWVVKRFMPASRMLTGAGVLEIVARLPLSGKQSLLLVKMGRRLILLGVTAERITSLDVLDDPEQVAPLLGELASRRPDSISHAFADAFGREAHQYMENEVTGGSPGGSVRGLLEKVRRLAGRQELSGSEK